MDPRTVSQALWDDLAKKYGFDYVTSMLGPRPEAKDDVKAKHTPSPHTLAKAELDAEARRIEAPVKETLRAAEALLVGIAAAERRNDE